MQLIRRKIASASGKTTRLFLRVTKAEYKKHFAANFGYWGEEDQDQVALFDDGFSWNRKQRAPFEDESGIEDDDDWRPTQSIERIQLAMNTAKQAFKDQHPLSAKEAELLSIVYEDIEPGMTITPTVLKLIKTEGLAMIRDIRAYDLGE